jgi:tetratricopeptide (TPR) repeat protein
MMNHTDSIASRERSSQYLTQGRYKSSLVLLLIFSHLALLIALYAQTRSFDYVFFDDNQYILDNPVVLNGLTIEGIKWAFTSVHLHNWHPLSSLSHMLDVSLFGIDPGWAHIHNMLIHGLNGLLVFGVILKISGSFWKAYILSIVFLAHPLHVESVAWIAERKDVLCAFFFLLGLLLYDRFRLRPSKLQYIGVLITYAMALLAKPMAVTFPIVLLILDFFVYRRYFQVERDDAEGYKTDYLRAIIEKLPFLALSIASCAITIVVQDSAVMQLEHHSMEARLIIASSAYVTYLSQFFFPVDLMVYYTFPTSFSLVDLIFPGAVLLLLLLLSRLYISKFPLIAAGLCIYLVTLLPVIGLVQVGNQAHADRYMYLPSVGVLIACTYLIPEMGKRYFKLGSAISFIFILYLSSICYWQVSYWKNGHSLFSRVLDIDDENYMAHIQLGNFYQMHKMLDESRQQLLKAISLRPDLPDAYPSMGNIALAEEDFEDAEKLYRIAVSVGGDTAELQNNIGVALAKQGRIEKAIKAFQKALQMDPTRALPAKNLEFYRRKVTEKTST